MPLIEITAEESRAGLAALGNDLACLLTDFAVAVEVRAVLGHVGLISVADLANYETEEQRFREAVTKDIGLATDNPKRASAWGGSWKPGNRAETASKSKMTRLRSRGHRGGPRRCPRRRFPP